MAHQTEIVVNGVVTEVTEFDHTAQEIDDGIDNLHTLTGGATTPQGALAALGAGVRPNLLDNAIFIGGGSQQGGGQLPVNQRGQTSYTVANAYGIDRWGSRGGTITVEQDSLKVSFPSEIGVESLFQYFEKAKFPSGVYTISILTKDEGLTSTTFDYNEDSEISDVQIEIKPGVILSLYARASWNYANARIFNRQASVELSPIAFKLEEGSTQTLAYQDEDGNWQLLPQPESDYATQLAKCQRYYQIYSTADARPSKAVDCRPVMRTDPAQGTIVVGDTTYYYNTAEL